ncbi:MAG: ABC transporter permease subunit [Actinobacteria bacterium]|nr:ABC transporter permease subunit [Actinomycetota bacterium]
MLILPLFILMSKLGLIDTFVALIIAYMVTALPFSIWLLKGYFDTIPFSLEEAARIDGCTQIGSFYRIVLPLSLPSVVIVGLFNFMAAWNDFILVRALVHDSKLFTWTLGLTGFIGSGDQIRWGPYAAASILIALPVTAIFLYSSKWLMSGLTLGALKE